MSRYLLGKRETERQRDGESVGFESLNILPRYPVTTDAVTFFIQTFFIRDKVYTNFLYTGQSLYGTKFIRGQNLYGDKVYTRTKFIQDKVYTVTKFIRGQSLYKLFSSRRYND